jgi:hypothetical protein
MKAMSLTAGSSRWNIRFAIACLWCTWILRRSKQFWDAVDSGQLAGLRSLDFVERTIWAMQLAL